MTESVLTRKDFPWRLSMATRWVDNDRYGHMNNAVYYSVFENALMRWLEIEQGFDLATGPYRCFTVQNGCHYHAAVKYPDQLECGLVVRRVGNSSVRYELGIFAEGRKAAAASGYIADVFVDASTERPIRIPDEIRAALASITVAQCG